MVQVAVPVVAILAGLFSQTWRKARLVTLVTFIVAVAIQTPVLIATGTIHRPQIYVPVQVLTLAVGLVLAWALFTRRQRRDGSDGRTRRARASSRAA